jgi:hypothetical protein
MSFCCPACERPFTQKEVVRTDEMLPGRKYYGWASCNYYCPHCKTLLDFVKPKAWPFIDAALLAIFIPLALSRTSHYQLFGSKLIAELSLLASFVLLFFYRAHLGKTKGRYVLA